MHGHKLFTSESVSGGHPDKVADQISDAVLDACLQAVEANGGAEDPGVRVACETLVRRDTVILAGEIRMPDGAPTPNYEQVAREAVADAGYSGMAVRDFDADSLDFLNFIDGQSEEIYDGTKGKKGSEEKLGAGDQGMMFGYAVNETPEYMPLPIQASHAILRLHDQYRKGSGPLWLRPDAKSQVTVEYDGKNKPMRIVNAIFSTHYNATNCNSSSCQAQDQCNCPKVSRQEVCDFGKKLVKEAMDSIDIESCPDEDIYVNNAGEFTKGGPAADSGLTGRKLMVDTYGAMGRHGGGAFSGKDPTKVDRSAAYACRYVAKNIVAAELAKECEVQLSYAIGGREPGLSINCFGTSDAEPEELIKLVKKNFDLSPGGIIEMLGLWQPFYRRYCVLGHFGQADAPWEKTDRADALKQS